MISNRELAPTDGDGSFSILTSKDIRGKLLCKVQPVFTIGLHKKDLPLLLMIQKYFGPPSSYDFVSRRGGGSRSEGVGNIHTRKADGTVYYNVSSVKDLINYLIPRACALIVTHWFLKRKQTISYLGK